MHSFYHGRHKNKIRTVRQYILAVVFYIIAFLPLSEFARVIGSTNSIFHKFMFSFNAVCGIFLHAHCEKIHL